MDCHKLKDDHHELSIEIDNLQQAQRNKTVRIMGIPEEKTENAVNKFMDIATNKMKINLQRSCIETAFSIGKASQKVNRQMLVKFTDETSKKNFYQGRIKLKDCKPAIYINEDLTLRRVQIATAARKAVKDNKIDSSWTMDGNIYVKYAPTQKPKKITSISDLEDQNENKDRPKVRKVSSKNSATAADTTITDQKENGNQGQLAAKMARSLKALTTAAGTSTTGLETMQMDENGETGV
jgi:hypothetical protein